MDAYRVVLYIHFLSLFVGIGAAAVLVTCLFQLRAARTVADAAPWGRVAGKIGRAFPIAILGLFGSGAYMTSDVWTWDTAWIIVGIVSLVVLAIQGPLVAERTGHKLGRTLQENGPGPLAEPARRMTLHPGLWVTEFTAIGLVLGNVWNMTTKPRTGGAIAAAAIGYGIGVALAFGITRMSKTAPAVEVQEPAAT